MSRGELILSIQLWLVVIIVAPNRHVFWAGSIGFVAGSIAWVLS